MPGLALSLVLTAAVLHASWNAIVKAAPDRTMVLSAIAAMNTLIGLVMVLVSASPAPASVPFVLASVLLHYLYYIFLNQSYRFGDLSRVYPISRGIAPVLVALGAYFSIGETLTPAGWASLGAISVGIVLLVFQRGPIRAGSKAVTAAIVTGVIIASYSVVDGIGVRLSLHPFGYMAWLFLLEFPVAFVIVWRRRAQIGTVEMRSFAVGLVGGVGSVAAYGLVIFANTLVQLGAVSAVRESSVIVATLIGIVLFHERPWRIRLFSAFVVGCGVVALAAFG